MYIYWIWKDKSIRSLKKSKEETKEKKVIEKKNNIKIYFYIIIYIYVDYDNKMNLDHSQNNKLKNHLILCNIQVNYY